MACGGGGGTWKGGCHGEAVAALRGYNGRKESRWPRLVRAPRGSASHHPAWLAGSSVGCRVSHTHTPNSSELPEDPIPSLAEMMVGGGSLGAAESHQARVGQDSQNWASGGEGKSPPAGRWGRDLHTAQQRGPATRESRSPPGSPGLTHRPTQPRLALREPRSPVLQTLLITLRPSSLRLAPAPPSTSVKGAEAQSRVRLHFRRGPLRGRRGPRSRGRGGPERWRRTEWVGEDGEVPARPTERLWGSQAQR